MANRVFARDGLAEYLDDVGADYERFAALHDVVTVLA
jgi:cell division septum initiation protein DivIVA